jgi:predicted nuclease with TOPRIM domain
MDYEFRIQLLEKETTHLKEMQRLLGDHTDITDDRLDKLQAITGGLVESMVELRTNVVQLTVTVDKLATKVDHFAKKVDELVEALLREPRNGKGSL